MSPSASGPLPEQAPSTTSFTQLCLLVDVTASKLKRIGRYNMGRIIGKGAFGTVRLAASIQTGALVASHCRASRLLCVSIVVKCDFASLRFMHDLAAVFSRNPVGLVCRQSGHSMPKTIDLA